MKLLWNKINAFNVTKDIKNKLYLGILILINAIIGGLVWFVFGRRFLSEIKWLFCFIGYPAMIMGFMGGILYLYNHEFK